MTARPPLARTLLRLFTVQGSWNYERMQGVGFGVAEEPLLRDLAAHGDEGAYRAAVARGALDHRHAQPTTSPSATIPSPKRSPVSASRRQRSRTTPSPATPTTASRAQPGNGPPR